MSKSTPLTFGRLMLRTVCAYALAVFAALFLLGCSANTKHVKVSADDSTFRSASSPVELTAYTLQTGDRLKIRFYRNPELDRELVVRPDGMISLPFVDEVRAEGLTPEQLDAELTRRYTGELATPDVSVIVQEFAGHRVFVGGEVGTQGSLPITGTLTLYQAVQEAGGFLATAHRKQVVVIRQGNDGRPVSRVVNLAAVQNGKDLSADIYLAPYDVVWVPRSAIADMNLFVQQVFRNNTPLNIGLNIENDN